MGRERDPVILDSSFCEQTLVKGESLVCWKEAGNSRNGLALLSFLS